jgi:uncharacterized membrane protein
VLVRLRAAVDGFRNSLFFFPALFVLAAFVLSQGMIALDGSLATEDVPDPLRFTVDSARSLLSAVATATITVAGIVFSLNGVAVQLASSQFSPRVLRTYMRDRFQQTVMGIMVGTFTYALLVMRAVRGSEDEFESVVPHLSVVLGLVLAVVAVLAILASIDHTARSMQVGEIVRRITHETVATARRLLPDPGEGPAAAAAEDPPLGEGVPVPALRTGWVQQVEPGKLLSALPPGAVIRLDVRVGSFVSEGVPLATVWGLDGTDPASELDQGFAVGRSRTMQQDIAFGIRQLVDIGLRALSTGVNDPTTAYEVVVHLGAVLHEVLGRDLPAGSSVDDDQRWLLRPHELTHDAYVERSFAQLRQAAAGQPDLCIGILRVLGEVVRELERRGLDERCGALRRQAALTVTGVAAAPVLPSDVDRLRAAAVDSGFDPRELAALARDGGDPAVP